MNSDLLQKSFFVIVTVLMAILAWQGTRIVDQLDKVSSSLTGHLIQHGRTDAKEEVLMDEVKKLRRNQIRICQYEELGWATHDRCER